MSDQPREEVLAGGVANAGRVVRVGDHVLRPAGAHHEVIHAFLRHVRARGFDAVPRVVALEPGGRERLDYIAGDVGIPPFPPWSQSDEMLSSAAALLRQLHDAGADFTPPPGAAWNTEIADPATNGSDIVWCHNDVCLENVIARSGEAIALIDFEYLAPGRRVFDLAALARMCCPVDAPENATRLGWEPDDVAHRLVVAADGYGLRNGRADLVDEIARVVHNGGAFVKRRMAEGDAAFIAMFEEMGGEERFRRRSEWLDAHADEFRDALRKIAFRTLHPWVD